MRVFLGWFVLAMLCSIQCLQAQDQEGATPQQQPGSKVIQLEELKIDVRQELPTVQILDRRIKGEFEQVKVSKDFQAELTGQTEKIVFKPITSGRVGLIENASQLLSKKRF